MPNYSLGALKGSPCDTIGKLQNTNVIVYPNPATDKLKMYYNIAKEEIAMFAIYDLLGNKVQEFKISGEFDHTTIALKELVTGVYVYRFKSNSSETYTGKLIID